MKRAVLALLLAGCATSSTPANEPEIRITQLSNVSEAARHMSGGLSVQYQVDVVNSAKTPITIKRIDLTSIGTGAYSVRPTSYPFNKPLAIGEATALRFWVPANIDDPTIVGANGPVSLRLTMQYDLPAGAAQTTVVQQVHATAGVN